MELLAPAGNIEKLSYAYSYGADAVYIGIRDFSLRAKADNFHHDEWKTIQEIKGEKKLFGALNIFFHNEDIRRLEEQIEYLAAYPFDAFIISDLGLLPLLKKYFPDRELHLSTQANCTNVEAAGVYRDLGFSRIIPGRETSLKEIEEIKRRFPDLEIEVFVHGAMCMAYSGRCFLSSFLSGRSANQGDCAHTCRWTYRVKELPGTLALEEKERPGELFPIIEGENFTTILSSRDLCMIDHLPSLRDAGVDSLKIEGRMKSIYYAAVVTRAYRKALDALERQSGEAGGNEATAVPWIEDTSWTAYREELHSVSHREFSTGFFFGKEEIEQPTERSYLRTHLFLGSIGEPAPAAAEQGIFQLNLKNQIISGTELEFISPDVLYHADSDYTLYDADMQPVEKADHGKVWFIRPSVPVSTGTIIRRSI